jgi:hypothetical protein
VFFSPRWEDVLKIDLDMILTECGEKWVASGEALEASGATLNELDMNLKNLLARSSRYSRGSMVTVIMRCDRRIIPAWMRPYHSHYFNRVVSIQL